MWISKLRLYDDCVESFPLGDLIYYALIKNESGMLLEMCQEDKTISLARGVVDFLGKNYSNLLPQ
jgi:hypothetical protein